MLEPDEILIAVPHGALGAGVRADEMERALSEGAQAIAVDAGSTDSGPFYLGRGVSKVSRESVKHDLKILMAAGAKYRVPVLVGSCGTSGCDDAVDWTRDIVVEIAAELDLKPRIALLYSEQDPAVIKTKLAAGRTRPLAPLPALTDDRIESCDRIVALMGPEPYIQALDGGADIILGGRTTDTGVLSAFALRQGIPQGLAWHAAKLTECGGLCTVNPTQPGVTMRLRQDSFDIAPIRPDNRCTPYSVSSHMLYENSDPFHLVEPGGVLNVRDARYVALDDRTVRVTGSIWEDRPYTMKLEGSGRGPFQTFMMVGIAAPDVLADIDGFTGRLHAALLHRVAQTIGDAAGVFDLSLRAYGWNALSGLPPAETQGPPPEIGLVLVVTAETQDLATRIAKTCNPYFFHFPASEGKELPSYGFPFSPAEIERGQVYEFRLNHVVEVDDPMELVRTAWIDLSADASSGKAVA